MEDVGMSQDKRMSTMSIKSVLEKYENCTSADTEMETMRTPILVGVETAAKYGRYNHIYGK